ncbi:MAG: RNA 2',3'-cyclic phosphodiesterase [Candidatus Omnitrophica bacterium]|nr:RNA 2',3'-cyclic phosphodiesterase [Candidatus Omnitrophota bacterium]MCM8826123.1 RNA 2',3'-cyclic phosphodiesterase [Candidatus Omnitrophota bacterium]
MRTFLAIPLSQNVKDYISEWENDFKRLKLYAKFVDCQNLHITLKFLGEINEDKVESIKIIMDEVVKTFKPLEVNLVDFGFFPNKNNPRVFFISTDKEEELKKLAYNIEDRLENLGFVKEERFKSHITIARFKSKKNIESLIKMIYNLKPNKSFLIDRIVLFKSIITYTGPIYEEIFTSLFKFGINE